MSTDIKFNQMRSFKAIIYTVSVLVLSSCSDEEPSLTESFFKIYDDSNFDLNYDPIDMVEITDGYIILTGTEQDVSNFKGVQMIRIDEEGNFVRSEENAFDGFEAPTGDLYFDDSDSSIYFLAKVSNLTDAVLIGIDPSLQIQSTSPPLGIGYPLSASPLTNGNMLIQSYDPVNLQTEIAEISPDGGSQGGGQFSIGAGNNNNLESLVVNHFTTNDESPIPFFCGENAGGYYFNGFSEFSLSMVFTDAGFNQTGVVQGQPINDVLSFNPINAGMRSVMPLGGSNFAVSGFQFDESYQLSNTALSTNGTTSSADLYPGNMAELRPYSNSKIFSYSTLGESYSVFASETKGNQIVLHFYNTASGEIEGVHYIGFLNRFNLASVKVTQDESILVLGTTFVAGRFERIFLNKISKGEIDGILN